jgi:hypothetical protein
MLIALGVNVDLLVPFLCSRFFHQSFGFRTSYFDFHPSPMRALLTIAYRLGDFVSPIGSGADECSP